MLDANFTSDLIQPFLQKAARINESGWIELAVKCLAQPSQSVAAISVTLTLSTPPEKLLAKVLSNMQGYAQLVEMHCIRNEISGDIIKLLLHHDDIEIASAAAIGEWLAEPKGTVREALSKDWKDVIIKRVKDATRSSRYWLKDILKQDPILAVEWLEAHITGRPAMFLKYKDVIETAANTLDTEARRRLVSQIPDTYSDVELVIALIGDNLALYTELLNNSRLKDLHLEPLTTGYPEGVWIEKAKLALDAGYSVEEVARAVFPFSYSWSGNVSDMWAEWVTRLEKLCSHEDPRIQMVGVAAKSHADEKRDRALQQERNEAVFGSSW
jgi:hypothetical protein